MNHSTTQESYGTCPKKDTGRMESIKPIRRKDWEPQFNRRECQDFGVYKPDNDKEKRLRYEVIILRLIIAAAIGAFLIQCTII